MEQQEAADIARVVFRYLREERLLELAERFYRTSPALANQQIYYEEDMVARISPTCTLRRISREYNEFLTTFSRMVFKCGDCVVPPSDLTLSEHAEHLMNYLYTFWQQHLGNVYRSTIQQRPLQASIETQTDTIVTSSVPAVSNASPIHNQPIIYEIESSPETGGNVTARPDSSSMVECQMWDMHGNPHIFYYQVPVNDDPVEQQAVVYEAEPVIIPDTVPTPPSGNVVRIPEILNTLDLVPVNLPSPRPTVTNVEKPQPPSDRSFEVDVPSTVGEAATASVSSMTPMPEHAQVRIANRVPIDKPAVDPVALAEWKRIRSVNRTNFDSYVREVNYTQEATKRLGDVLMQQSRDETPKTRTGRKKGTEKREPPPVVGIRTTRSKIARKTLDQSLGDGRMAKDDVGGKKKESPKPKTTINVSQPGRRSYVGVEAETDSATTSDECDAEIRTMKNNVKRYRHEQDREARLLSANDKRPGTNRSTVQCTSSAPSLPEIVTNPSPKPKPTAVRRRMSAKPEPLQMCDGKENPPGRRPLSIVLRRSSIATDIPASGVGKNQGRKNSPSAAPHTVMAKPDGRRPVRSNANERNKHLLIPSKRNPTRTRTFPTQSNPMPTKKATAQVGNVNDPPKACATPSSPDIYMELEPYVSLLMTPRVSVVRRPEDADELNTPVPASRPTGAADADASAAAIDVVLAQLYGNVE